MKFKIIIIVIAGFILTGKSEISGKTPVIPVSNDDTNKAGSNLKEIPSFYYQLQANLPVNEGEIRAGLLYDVVNQKIVWQKNVSGLYPIASLTKMMVALLAVEDVRAGKYSWTDNVKWTRETIIGRKSNRKKIYTNVAYSLRDAFKATMIASNNECSDQMARYLGNGNLQITIDRMNARAKELGMLNTYYGNPTGLPAAHSMFDNRSTPSDQLILSIEMLKYSEVIEIASMGYAEIENGKKSSVIHNHNKLTIDYSGDVDGLKTGYTKRAGFCLVATTAKCNHRLISIVLGCRGPAIRNEVVRDMFNEYYTTIGLDKLGPQPLIAGDNLAISNIGTGRYVTVYEPANKIYTVKKGESLSTIASRHKCSTSQIKKWNSNKIRDNRIYAGQKIILKVSKPKSIFIQDPVNGSESEDDKPLMTATEKKELDKAAEQANSETPVVNSTPKANTDIYLYHTVAPGDTLFNIASRYDGVSVAELKALNNITNGQNLRPGTKLKVKVQS